MIGKKQELVFSKHKPPPPSQSNRQEYNFLSMNQQTSTPIRSTNKTTYGIMTNTTQQATNIQN